MSVGTRAIAVAVALVLVGCSATGPSRKDVRPEAYVGYPGATVADRQWEDEEHARSIEGPDLSHPARLTLDFTLAEPVTDTALFDWYDQQLASLGWTRISGSSSGNVVLYRRTVGDRLHSVAVHAGEASGDLVADYRVAYTIGYARD